MNIVQVPILDASEIQRRQYATAFLGLDIEPTDSDNVILNKIMLATNNSDMISVIEIDAADVAALSQAGSPPPAVAGSFQPEMADAGAIQGSLGKDDPRAVIRIETEERNGQTVSTDVPVGVNGRAWQIKRGVEANVPWRVVESLKAAIKDVVTHDENGAEIITQARSYPWTLVSSPSAAEIAAWRERTDSVFLP